MITNIKKEKGITLVALVITIILMLIIATITINIGKGQILNAHLQNYKTNMLLIEAKAKEYVEKASFNLGVNPTDETRQNAQNELQGEGKGTLVTSTDSIIDDIKGIGVADIDTQISDKNVYKLSTSDLENMGINGAKSDEEEGYYILIYNIPESTVKVYNTLGFNIGDEVKYCLDDIREIREARKREEEQIIANIEKQNEE